MSHEQNLYRIWYYDTCTHACYLNVYNVVYYNVQRTTFRQADTEAQKVYWIMNYGNEPSLWLSNCPHHNSSVLQTATSVPCAQLPSVLLSTIALDCPCNKEHRYCGALAKCYGEMERIKFNLPRTGRTILASTAVWRLQCGDQAILSSAPVGVLNILMNNI